MSALTTIDISPQELARARAGDRAQQRRIYELLAAPLFALIRRMVGKTAGEDLFQDTMVKVLERLGDYRAEAPLGAWARQIAINECLMYLRSPWRRARVWLRREGGSDEEALDELVSRSPVIAEHGAAIDVERLLGTLPQATQAVVHLFEIEGYSHAEIAAAFGRSASYSKSQLARAHRRLRQLVVQNERRETWDRTINSL